MSGLKVHPPQRICTLVRFDEGRPVILSVSFVVGDHPFGLDATTGLLHLEGYVNDVSEIKDPAAPLPSKSEQKRRAIRQGSPIPCPVCAVQQRRIDFEGEAS